MFTMKNERESKYWDCNSSTFNFLNSPLQESLGLNPVMIVYDLFWESISAIKTVSFREM